MLNKLLASMDTLIKGTEAETGVWTTFAATTFPTIREALAKKHQEAKDKQQQAAPQQAKAPANAATQGQQGADPHDAEMQLDSPQVQELLKRAGVN
eukprot:5886270-Prorocentrum_lima.AAC.1